MIIVLKRNSSETDIATASDMVCSLRYQPRVIRGVEQTVIACVGDELSHQSLEVLRNLPAVESVFPVQKKFKLVSREYHPQDTVVDVGGVRIGGGNIEIEIAWIAPGGDRHAAGSVNQRHRNGTIDLHAFGQFFFKAHVSRLHPAARAAVQPVARRFTRSLRPFSRAVSCYDLLLAAMSDQLLALFSDKN